MLSSGSIFDDLAGNKSTSHQNFIVSPKFTMVQAWGWQISLDANSTLHDHQGIGQVDVHGLDYENATFSLFLIQRTYRVFCSRNNLNSKGDWPHSIRNRE